MYICPDCKIFYQNHLKPCQKCGTKLTEVSLVEALQHTDARFLRNYIEGKNDDQLSDLHKQYHLRSYLKNHSLFLDYDIQKNRMKHGPRLKRFLICKVDMTAVFNIPWFFFNIITSNIFHMKYTKYCPRCNTKYIPKKHSQEDCDYNIEYFNILEDILSGNITAHKQIYKFNSQEKQKKGWASAYHDLFYRKAHIEAFWDLFSITISILFWVFIAVYISWPFAKVLSQKIQHIDQYEFGIVIN